jgi:hypothetical protein
MTSVRCCYLAQSSRRLRQHAVSGLKIQVPRLRRICLAGSTMYMLSKPLNVMVFNLGLIIPFAS